MLLSIILLLLTFYFLALVCDYFFVPALEKISKKLELSSEFAGATLMAVWSSAPELFTSLFAVLNPTVNSSLWAGTIVWSALFNILVIIWAAALVRNAKINRQPVARDTLFYCISILLLLSMLRDGQVVLREVIVLVVLYVVYVYVAKKRSTRLNYSDDGRDDDEWEEEEPTNILAKWSIYILKKIIPSYKWKHYRWTFVVSILFIAGLSHIMVESAVHLAELFSIPPAIIGLTILAAGTSIPDLLSSVAVAKKWKGDMAISNAIGSNIFDILFGLWFPYMLYFFIFGMNESIPVNSDNLTSSIILLFASVLVVIAMLVMKKRNIGKPIWYILIGLYIIYVSWTVWQVI